MNWQKIKNKYSKAYKAFTSWQLEKETELPFNYTFSIRDFYDFFDSHGIRLFVSLADNGGVFKNGDATDRNFIVWSEKTFGSRIDAEYKAFEKGFELLEKKIKKNATII